jgi:hypothetical protein
MAGRLRIEDRKVQESPPDAVPLFNPCRMKVSEIHKSLSRRERRF